MKTKKQESIQERINGMRIDIEPVGRLVGYENNAKIHTSEQIDKLKNSITRFGFDNPFLVWTNEEGKSEIIAGHGRLMAALELGIENVPVVHLDHLTDEERRALTHIDNQLTMNTGWDFDMLEKELEGLDFDWDSFGFDIYIEGIDNEFEEVDRSGNLKKNFGFVPFSVVSATSGDWLERKRQWIAKGIRSELGRGGVWHIIPGLWK